MSPRSEKRVFNSVLNFRRVTYFFCPERLCDFCFLERLLDFLSQEVMCFFLAREVV